MNPAQIVVACPCGGHSLTLPATRLPVGGRAAFTCPACGLRRTCLRTEQGVVVDEAPPPAGYQPQGQGQAPAQSQGQAPPPGQPRDEPQAGPLAAMAAQTPDTAPHTPGPRDQTPARLRPEPALPPPRPLLPGADACALAADLDAGWLTALDAALPPGWQVLAGDDPAQTAADCAAHLPRLLLLGEGPAASAALAAANALPGRQREAVTVVTLHHGPDNDALAAFARSADAVLDARNPDARGERLRAALARIAARPALFASQEDR